MDIINPQSILPYDGETLYYGQIITSEQAKLFFDTFLNTIAWKNDEAKIFGKHFITKRKAAWYGDREFDYKYSNTTKTALIWTPELLQIKKITEEISGTKFNSCLLNLYHDGDEGMSWHSDDEKSLGKNTVIASLSLGVTRKFSFKHKASKETISLLLESGSLLVMKGSTQTNWLHSLPKSKKVSEPRINLTFRTIII